MNSPSSSKSMNMWLYKGQQKPDFAIEPGADQESVWDYPRPPCIETDSRKIRVLFEDQLIAETDRARRVLETASPPTFYIPPQDVDIVFLAENSRRSFCEWKGQASYFNYDDHKTLIQDVAWFYRNPSEAFSSIRNHICFYPSKLDCYVDDIKVQSQAGDYYGGWITPDIVGPFKGDPGTGHW